MRLVLPIQSQTLSIVSLIRSNRACPCHGFSAVLSRNRFAYSQLLLCAVRVTLRRARYSTSDPSAVPDLSDRNFGALSAAVCLHRACTICDIHITRHGFCRCSRQCRDLVGLSRWRNLLKHERPRDASHRLVKAITTPRLSTATVP